MESVWHETLALHVILQLRRTRQYRNVAKELAQRAATLQANLTLAQRLEDDDFDDNAEREVARSTLDKLSSGELTVEVRDESLSGVVIDRIGELASILLSGWNWVVVVLDSPKFITSDSPVCMLGEPSPPVLTTNVGLETALEIWFPLDAEHALVLSRDLTLPSHIDDLAGGHVRTINMRLAFESERWCFFHPRSKGVQGLQIPTERSEFVQETMGRSVRADGAEGELIRLGLKRPHVPNERLLSGRRLQRFRR